MKEKKNEEKPALEQSSESKLKSSRPGMGRIAEMESAATRIGNAKSPWQRVAGTLVDIVRPIARTLKPVIAIGLTMSTNVPTLFAMET